jgi:hypothetical protein
MGRPCFARLFFGCGVLAACAGAGATEAANAAAPAQTSEEATPRRTTFPVMPEANGPIRASLERIDVLETGTSDRKALKAAKAAVPLNRLSPGDRRRAEAVLSDLSMFRKMPTLRLDVDHDAYRYFVEHPDVAVSIWRALGASKCQLWQTGPDAYETDVGDGSTGAIDVLLRGEKDHLVIGEGEFKSPLLVKPIRATGLVHLRTEYVIRPDGGTEAICRGALFVAFPSQTVETAAKVISPVTNKIIDRNFEEIGLFAHMMSEGMQSQPGWVEDLAGRLDGILERRRSELLQVTAKAYVTNKKRELVREGRPVTAEAIAPPIRGTVLPAGR